MYSQKVCVNIFSGDFMKKYFGDLKFVLLVLSVAIPIMLQNLIQTSVNLVDSLMVGQLGDAAIGGVAAVNRYFLILNGGMFGLTSAVAIFIAQFYGARNEVRLRESFRFSIIASYFVILPFFIIAFLFPKEILSFFTQDATLIEAGVNYLRYACYTFLPIGISMSISGAMRCIGETKIPLVASVISVFINTFLNYCLIFGKFGMPELGVAGAAVATLIARLVEMTLLLIVLKFTDFPFKTRVQDLFDIDPNLIKQITLKAAPLAMNEILWSAGNAMMLKFYGTRGGSVLSGNAICGTFTDIFYTLFSGMSVATTIMVSQPLGANELEKAKENGYRMVGAASILAFCLSCLMVTTIGIVPMLYGSASSEVLNIAKSMIIIQAVTFPIYTLNIQSFNVLRAGGDAKSTLILDSGFMWAFTIPMLALFAYFTDINIYLLFALGRGSELVKLVLSYILLRKEKWVVNLTNN